MPVFAVEIYDVVKALHIMAVVGAFGLPLAYPALFAYAQKHHASSLGALHDIQLRLNRRVTGTGTVLILLFGAYLATKEDLWSEVWVTVPLIIIFVIGGVGGALINPPCSGSARRPAPPTTTPSTAATCATRSCSASSCWWRSSS